MRTVVHLSDLHFGRIDHQVLEPLADVVHQVAPDVIAVSGDLTQRARVSQFKQARAFLERLPFPQLVVPGNHDVPLFNLAVRFTNPLGGYLRYIAQDLHPTYRDQEMIAVGLNSARSSFGGGGRLNEVQVERAAAQFREAPDHLIRIVVTHHPFDLPVGHHEEHIIGRSRMAMERLAAVGADLFLAGHLHVSHVGHTAERYKIANHSALVLQAGTISLRGRGEPNSFNVVRLARPSMSVDRLTWDAERRTFVKTWSGDFDHTPLGWIRRDPA